MLQSSPPPKQWKEGDKFVAATIAAVQYNEKQSRVDHIYRRKEVETIDDNKLDTNWWDNFNICVPYARILQKIWDTPADFQRMWDGLLGPIDTAEHHIELTTLDYALSTPPHSMLDRKHASWKCGIQKMLDMNIIEPAQS